MSAASENVGKKNKKSELPVRLGQNKKIPILYNKRSHNYQNQKS